MEELKILFLIFIGIVAGFCNTIAGGGSLLTLPILIFLGLSPAIANGTNRIALFFQNITGVIGFKSKGLFVFPYSLWASLSALFGAIIGAKFSVKISEELYTNILAVVMIIIMIVIIINPIRNQHDETLEKLDKKSQIISIIIFFFIGIYGGFIQAGVGFMMIGTLTLLNKVSLVKANSIKVFVGFIYTIAVLLVFILEDKINWSYGLTLALGNSIGAWYASRWSVKNGDVWVRRFMILIVTAMAITLFVR